jgi:hydrogenase-4 component F
VDLLLLLLLPPVTGVLCRIMPRRLDEVANVVGAAATLVVGLWVVARVYGGAAVGALGGVLRVDALGALLIAVIVVVGFLAALYSVGYLRRDVEHGEVPADQVGWYYLGYHVFIWTMLVTVSVDDLGLMWAAIEGTTIVSALLVGFNRTRAALEAAWKYLILCTVGIIFALFGVLLTYYASLQALGEHAGLSLVALTAEASRLDPSLTKLAFVFVLIGFGTKAGFAPLHTWLPDAHSQAPSPISAVLSGVLLNCALYGILRFHQISVGAVGPQFSQDLLLGFGLVSVAVATPFVLVQRDLKRLLAYSSVEHIGLTAVAIGLGGPLGLYAGLLHLVNHALAKSLLFFVAGELVQRYGTRRIRAIRGAVQALPLAGTLLFAGAFAITGLPPFGIFVSELGIAGAGFERGHGLIVVALVALLAVIFAGVFAHVAGMALGTPGPLPAARRVDRTAAISLLLPALGVLLLGLYVPPPLSNALDQAAALLQRGGL